MQFFWCVVFYARFPVKPQDKIATLAPYLYFIVFFVQFSSNKQACAVNHNEASHAFSGKADVVCEKASCRFRLNQLLLSKVNSAGNLYFLQAPQISWWFRGEIREIS